MAQARISSPDNFASVVNSLKRTCGSRYPRPIRSSRFLLHGAQSQGAIRENSFLFHSLPLIPPPLSPPPPRLLQPRARAFARN